MASSTSAQFPTKEQAIVFNAIEGLKLDDYVVAIGNIVTPKNVLFASRISNSRICMYLSSKDLVEKTVSEHGVIVISGKEITVRRLLNPAKRIILSNVCPCISHSVIENLVKNLGFVTVTPMSFLRAGIHREEYNHVLSFRRQIFVQPNNSIDLPSSMVLKFEETNYRIYMSYDDVCYKCRQAGHFANDCTSNVSPTPESNKETVGTGEGSGKRKSTDDDNALETNPVDISANSRETILDTRDADLKRKKSSDSTESLTSTFELLSPARSLFGDSEQQYPLSFDQLVEFADKVPGESNILELIHKYTSDIEGVSTMLYEIFPSLEHKSIRNRCRKIQRKIKKAQSNILDDNSHNMEVVVTTQDTKQ
jgi:hypothetical protein